VTVLQRCGNRK